MGLDGEGAMTWGANPPESPAELLERIRKAYPDGWFAARDVKAKVPELKVLEARGMIESTRHTKTNSTYWRLKEGKVCPHCNVRVEDCECKCNCGASIWQCSGH